MLKPSFQGSVKVFKTKGGSVPKSLLDFLEECFVGRLENLRGFFITERHAVVPGQHADAVVDLAENFREVGRRKHESANIVSQFEFRNSNVLSYSTPYGALRFLRCADLDNYEVAKQAEAPATRNSDDSPRSDRHETCAVGPYHPDAALQSGLRILQRVR